MTQTIIVYEESPADFNALLEVAACYIEVHGKILLLQQGCAKQDPGKWGVPAGKLEAEEIPSQAARRELLEETGIWVQEGAQLTSLGCLYIRKYSDLDLDLDYIYYLFQIHLDELPAVTISREHQAYQWVEKEHLFEVPFMLGAKEGIECYQKRKEGTRSSAFNGMERERVAP